MTDTNQKLREALQRYGKHDRDCGVNNTRFNCACNCGLEAALALPTADHIPDAGEMVADHFPDATKMIETAAPVGEREAFERTMMDKFGWERKDFKTDERDVYMDGHTVTAWMTWQARAALSAGDAVDAQRWKTSQLISRAALTHPDKRTEQMNIAFNAYRKAMESGQSYAACVDAAIDASMRKGQL